MAPRTPACLADAVESGTPAVYVVRTPLDSDGHVIITTYLVTGVHQVRVTEDRTRLDPPGDVTTTECTGFSTAGYLFPQGCKPA